ncbi:MAG: polymer-forming cytoskeletal protein [Anaerolineae bacterium]|jgi:hypothetical protein|nr:polymer-forming cytoskeletal protein [Anaerolineae bacterium]MBT7072498.1 polymer-forming cytoskeletal protein [Anaerolineae bacterium]MBT7325723.1 polymer-forming cytoskeletal protein [Anaerolineae bacterium]
MSRNSKIFTTLTIFVMLALILVPTASAFDGREGGRVVIEADEIVEDDLYIGAETVIVDGVIQGDLYTGAQTVTINGTVEGDLVTGAQSVIINGTVGDDVRAFAAAIQLGKEAVIGDDLLFGGASLEVMPGSIIGGDIVVGGAQVLVAGDVAGDILAGTSAFELSGRVDGNVKAYVDSSSEGGENMPPNFYGPQMNIAIPSVAPGITITNDAKINGDLTYTSATILSFPANAVGGETLRVEPEYVSNYEHPAPPTPQQMAGFWALSLLRTIITLIALGMLMQWLFPNFLASAEYKLQTETWQSLGWGVVAYAFFFFALLVVFTAMILGAIIFGFLSLGGLSGTIVILGLLTLFALIVGFILTVAYLTKIIVATLGGKLLLARFKPEWVNHKFYPLAIGVIILALFMSVPAAGWIIKWVVILFALGALWLLAREQFGKKETVVEA